MLVLLSEAQRLVEQVSQVTASHNIL